MKTIGIVLVILATVFMSGCFISEPKTSSDFLLNSIGIILLYTFGVTLVFGFVVELFFNDAKLQRILTVAVLIISAIGFSISEMYQNGFFSIEFLNTEARALHS